MLVRCGIAQSDISQATRRIASSVWATKKQGPAAIEERKSKAEAILQTTAYTGNDGHSTWDDYIRVRQNVHLELALLQAPVDKKRMVALMLDGVKAHGLEPVRVRVRVRVYGVGGPYNVVSLVGKVVVLPKAMGPCKALLSLSLHQLGQPRTVLPCLGQIRIVQKKIRRGQFRARNCLVALFQTL
jgi:hypothetical protein